MFIPEFDIKNFINDAQKKSNCTHLVIVTNIIDEIYYPIFIYNFQNYFYEIKYLKSVKSIKINRIYKTKTA